MKSRWESEKGSVDDVKKLKGDIEQMHADIESAQQRFDYERAAKLKYSDLPALEKKLAEAEQRSEERKNSSLVHDTVTEEEIAGIVAKWTGIPVSRLMEGEREKILHLDEIIHKRVIGQDEAVRKVTEAILRSRAGIADPNRPIGSFLFLGPTGVGKTELAKSLAECLFDDEHNMWTCPSRMMRLRPTRWSAPKFLARYPHQRRLISQRISQMRGSRVWIRFWGQHSSASLITVWLV